MPRRRAPGGGAVCKTTKSGPVNSCHERQGMRTDSLAAVHLGRAYVHKVHWLAPASRCPGQGQELVGGMHPGRIGVVPGVSGREFVENRRALCVSAYGKIEPH